MIDALTWLLTAEVITWLLTIELIGLAAFPIGFLFFSFLPDRGYSFSKILGLLLMGYLLWIGATIHIIPNARWSIILILSLIALLSAGIVLRHRQQFGDFLKSNWRTLLVIDGFFVVAFAMAVILASYVSQLSFGSPKLFELAFVNAIIRSDYFPPEDPWLAGQSISYYYFGHLNVASLTKLVDLPTSTSYTLALALFAALAASGAYGIVFNLVRGDGAGIRYAVIFGALSAVFLIFLGNIEGVFELLAVHGVGSEGFYGLLDIQGLDGPQDSSAWYPTDGYRRAIAFEGPPQRLFPFYELMLGILYAGSLGAPYALLVVAVALNTWRSGLRLQISHWLSHPLELLLAALAVGATGFAHTWDLPGLLLLIFITVAIGNYLTGRRFLEGLYAAVGYLAPLAALALLLYLPFYLTIGGSGIGVALVEVRHAIPPVSSAVTSPLHLMYAWLPFLWLVSLFGRQCRMP